MKPLNPEAIKAEIAGLLARHPELAEDEALRLDMIEGQTDAIELLKQLVRTKAEADAYAKAIKEYEGDLASRRHRMERRADGAKELAFRIMRLAELRKVPLAEATLFETAGVPKVIITDEAAIPEHFIKVERTPKKKEILDAIKGGQKVAGAEISNSEPSLTIRMN